MPREFVEQMLNKLFGSSKEGEPADPPSVSEKLSRNRDYLDRYLEWTESPRSAALLLRLKNLHLESDDDGNDFFHRYSSPQANGFFFDGRAGIEKLEFDYLLDHFRDVALGLDYRIYTSDRKLTEKSNSVQKIDRHYLKPAISRDQTLPMDQKYGNVLIEYVSYNEKPAYLKVMVTCYSDRSFTEVLPYEHLAEKLFSPLNPGR